MDAAHFEESYGSLHLAKNTVVDKKIVWFTRLVLAVHSPRPRSAEEFPKLKIKQKIFAVHFVVCLVLGCGPFLRVMLFICA